MSILNEKYRPHKFEDVIGLDPAIPELVSTGMPHFLFFGDAGCGKTTTAKIIIAELGSDKLLLNASEERGIDTVRNKIKAFCQTISTNGKKKIVFLDEADFLTKESQTSLRNLMEEYHTNARFILTANYQNKIIDPLKSRCTPFHFKQLSDEQITARISHIAQKENIVANSEGMEKVAHMARGDLRTAINLLQKFSTTGTLVVAEQEKHATTIMDMLKQKKFMDARKYIIENINDHEGLLREIFGEMLNGDYSIHTKKVAIREIAEALFRMNFVADKEIQLSATLLTLMGEMNA